MNKYTFVLFAFLMGALALQAQSYQTSFTYEDAPDSLKNSVFSKDGKALFDTLYLGQGPSWKEYFRIYHHYYEGYSQTETQKANATCSGTVPTIYYINPTNGNSVSWGTSLNCGRTPRYKNDHAYWGQYGEPGEWDKRFMYSNRWDGFLLDNMRSESTTCYYGYYEIERTRSITITQRRYKQAKSDWSLFGGTTYYYTSWTLLTPTEDCEVTLETTYKFVRAVGSVTDKRQSPELTFIPSTSYPSDPEAYARGQFATYPNNYWTYDNPDEDYPNSKEISAEVAFNRGKGGWFQNDDVEKQRIYQTRTKTYSYTDKPRVWARLITEADGTQHLDYKYKQPDGGDMTQGTSITITGAIGDDFSNAYINDWTEGELNREDVTTVFDTVAQVRHHIYLVTPRSLETGLYLPEEVESYYDTTFYDLDYSWSGLRYVSSKPGAAYHEYDTEYETTGTITNLNSKNKTETLVNNVTRAAMMVYAKQDENTYRFDHSMETSTTRVGEVRDKKIYIAGEATALCTTKGDGLGWMQPVNTDIYLENVRLQAADPKLYLKVFDDEISMEEAAQGYHVTDYIKYSSAVFFLKENDARFHFKGKNYLGGQLAGKFTFRINVTGIPLVDEEDVSHQVPKYSAPIEICDELSFASAQPTPITCTLDDTWADGVITKGYLDLSSVLSKDYTFNPQSTPFHNGMRYAPPLYTGGNHGSFVINGGHINLWAANGYSADVVKAKEKFGVSVKVADGHASNYLMCGYSSYRLSFNGNKFEITGDFGLLKYAIKDIQASASVNGSGMGIPAGKLIINGGTVTTETDTMSFGYRYTEKVGNNTVNKTADNNPNGQPIFAPNVEINGGTFWNDIYTATNHTTDSAWNKAVTYKAVVNTPNQPLVRTECDLPAPNTDYSHWQEDSLKLNREGRDERVIVVNPFEDNQYVYGFTGVKSDAQSNGYFYLPSDNWKWSKNFFAKPSQPIESYEGYLPYNLTVEAGGIVNEASDTRLLGIPRYVRTFTDNKYVALCMPFKVVGISDAYGDMDAYVEKADNPNPDNSNAYFYMYHMRDEDGEARTTGINESFRRNYHTHAEGNYMEQGRTYLVKFPNTTGEPYWSEAPVTFRGEAMDTVKGSATFALPTRPDVDTTFVMGGNATFAEKALSGNYYVVDAAAFGGDDDFHVKSDPTLAPCEGFLLGNLPTMDRFRSLGARPRPQENTPDEGTTTDSDIVEAEQEHLSVYAAEGAIHVLADYDTEAYIYTVAGQYITTLTLQAHQPQSVSVPQGVYLVRSNEEVKKAVVD